MFSLQQGIACQVMHCPKQPAANELIYSLRLGAQASGCSTLSTPQQTTVCTECEDISAPQAAWDPYTGHHHPGLIRQCQPSLLCRGKKGACLQLSPCADDAILQMAAIMHNDAVHEHAVDYLHIAAQLAHCAQHAALDAALVPACT